MAVASRLLRRPERPQPTADQRALAGKVLLASISTIAMFAGMSLDGNPWSRTSVGVGGTLILLAVPWRPTLPSRPWLLTAVAMAVVPSLWKPLRIDAQFSGWHRPAVPLSLIGLAVAAAIFWDPGRGWIARHQRHLALVGVGLGLVAMLFAILGSRQPRIDVWVIFQQSGHGLWRGINPYEMHFTGVPPGQTDDCFNYLPVSFITAALGVAVRDESRMAELAVLGAGWVALATHVWRQTSDGIGRATAAARQASLGVVVLAVALPGALRVAQTGWNESVAMGFLLMAVVLVRRGSAWWAIVPLALAMASKQHILMLLPIWALWPQFGWRRAIAAGGLAGAVVAPWFLLNPDRFVECTVTFFLELPARANSVSIYPYVPSGVAVAGQLLLVAAVLLGVWRRGVPTAADCFAWCGAITVAFNMFNKQTFLNQWWLSATLLVLSLALRVLDDEPDDAVDSAPQVAGR